MPNIKHPCIECKRPVKSNQKALGCESCPEWVHLKCTDITYARFSYLAANVEAPFFCKTCKPRCNYSDVISQNHDNAINDSSSVNTSLNHLSLNQTC